jgi:hypothetical protein
MEYLHTVHISYHTLQTAVRLVLHPVIYVTEISVYYRFTSRVMRASEIIENTFISCAIRFRHQCT